MGMITLRTSRQGLPPDRRWPGSGLGRSAEPRVDRQTMFGKYGPDEAEIDREIGEQQPFDLRSGDQVSISSARFDQSRSTRTERQNSVPVEGSMKKRQNRMHRQRLDDQHDWPAWRSHTASNGNPAADRSASPPPDTFIVPAYLPPAVSMKCRDRHARQLPLNMRPSVQGGTGSNQRGSMTPSAHTKRSHRLVPFSLPEFAPECLECVRHGQAS